jgi:hypothetical protein
LYAEDRNPVNVKARIRIDVTRMVDLKLLPADSAVGTLKKSGYFGALAAFDE